MRKGERTRHMIIQRTAGLLNRQGYLASSMSNIMQETGLEKGGIYNHFSSKEDLTLEAFDFSVEAIRKRYVEALEGKANAVDRLLTFVTVFQGLLEDPPVPGGCPIMNAAIESDDAHPVLCGKARQAMDRWYQDIRRTVDKGKEKREIRADVDPDVAATLVIATLEGSLMMTRLFQSKEYIRHAVDHLKTYIETMKHKEEIQ